MVLAAIAGGYLFLLFYVILVLEHPFVGAWRVGFTASANGSSRSSSDGTRTDDQAAGADSMLVSRRSFWPRPEVPAFLAVSDGRGQRGKLDEDIG